MCLKSNIYRTILFRASDPFFENNYIRILGLKKINISIIYILYTYIEFKNGAGTWLKPTQNKLFFKRYCTVYANQEESTFDMLKKTQKSGFILIILEERQFINYYLPTAIVFMEIECHKSSHSFIWQKIQ